MTATYCKSSFSRFLKQSSVQFLQMSTCHQAVIQNIEIRHILLLPVSLLPSFSLQIPSLPRFSPSSLPLTSPDHPPPPPPTPSPPPSPGPACTTLKRAKRRPGSGPQPMPRMRNVGEQGTWAGRLIEGPLKIPTEDQSRFSCGATRGATEAGPLKEIHETSSINLHIERFSRHKFTQRVSSCERVETQQGVSSHSSINVTLRGFNHLLIFAPVKKSEIKFLSRIWIPSICKEKVGGSRSHVNQKLVVGTYTDITSDWLASLFLTGDITRLPTWSIFNNYDMKHFESLWKDQTRRVQQNIWISTSSILKSSRLNRSQVWCDQNWLPNQHLWPLRCCILYFYFFVFVLYKQALLSLVRCRLAVSVPVSSSLVNKRSRLTEKQLRCRNLHL